MIIGIDGTNLISGGGLIHLTELIRNADSEKHQFKKIVIWAPQTTLDRLVDCPWLKKCSVNFNESNFIFRALWYWRHLDKLAKNENCSLLFIPGGLVLSRFRPIVTMNQNLLPFSWREIVRYGFSLMTIRLMMLRLIQKRTFRKADGIIFLSNYAKQTVENITGTLKQIEVIPHGLNKRFLNSPHYTRSIEKCTIKKPFRILYVSIIDAYKHQWHIVNGISKIRHRTNWPLVLDLVGPAHPPSMRRLKKTIDLYDPDSEWVKYYGSVPYEQIHNFSLLSGKK